MNYNNFDTQKPFTGAQKVAIAIFCLAVISILIYGYWPK